MTLSPEREAVAFGDRPCETCGKAHNAYRKPGTMDWGSWADPDDGHPYRKVSWERLARERLTELDRLHVKNAGFEAALLVLHERADRLQQAIRDALALAEPLCITGSHPLFYQLRDILRAALEEKP